jgi:N-acetylglucosaminyldiphosphoundecaprenol N-acetyl-beta-D-mannosaminyltransferase
MDRIEILHIPFDRIRTSEIPEKVDEFVLSNKQHIIATPNPEMVLESLKNKDLQGVLQQASLSIPDGIGILWAAKFLSLPSRPKIRIFFQWIGTLLSLLCYPKYCKTILHQRVTGVDSMKQICSSSEQNKYSIFLLGGKGNIAQQTKIVLEQWFPHISIVGTYPGQPFTEDDNEIVRKINASQPKILFVAFGSPKQELWIRTYLAKIPSIKVAMGIGGAFDFISGTIKRAPLWMQRTGLEWLYRLFQEPKKRIPRIWNAVVVFPLQVLIYKLNGN